MAYSTVAQIKANETELNSSNYDAVITDRIAQADKIIETEFANVIDFTSMPAIGDTPATPDYVNLLSQYKATELSLVYYHSAKRDVTEVNDIKYYIDMYNNLKKQILDGTIDLGDYGLGLTTYDSDYMAKPDVAPVFGEAEYGDYISDTDLADERELPSND